MSAHSRADIDATSGPVVRPYAITHGRVRSATYDLDLVTLVVALHERTDIPGCEPEHEQILRLCRHPISVAEVAARISLPLTVVKVLLADLIDMKHLIYRPMVPSAAHDPQLLQAVLDGIRDI